jgi:hypothetical protein
MSSSKKAALALAAALLTTMISAQSFASGPSNTSVHVNGTQNAGFYSMYSMILSGAFVI